MNPQTDSRLLWGASLGGVTTVALVLPLVLPLPAAIAATLVTAGVLFWVGVRLTTSRELRRSEEERLRERDHALPPLPMEPVPSPPVREAIPPVVEPGVPGPRVKALQDLGWTLHAAIIGRIRSLLGPLSDNLFSIKNDLRGLLAKSAQLETSFRNDSQGLHQTVGRFEAQSVTIRTFASEMDKSVTQFEASSRVMADRLGTITQAIQQINDVAERIKVLSINASIEAARAGHQGAGFKVISQEVRKLAEDTNQFSDQAEKTISESITEIQEMFQRFIAQYQSRAQEIHQIRATTQELETFLKGLFRMIEGIFQDYDGFVGSLEANLDQISPTLQQAEIGTQQIENTWKGIRDFLEGEPAFRAVQNPSRSASLTHDEALGLVRAFSHHLTTPLEAEVVDAWAQNAGVALASNKKNDAEDITLF